MELTHDTLMRKLDDASKINTTKLLGDILKAIEKNAYGSEKEDIKCYIRYEDDYRYPHADYKFIKKSLKTKGFKCKLFHQHKTEECNCEDKECGTTFIIIKDNWSKPLKRLQKEKSED